MAHSKLLCYTYNFKHDGNTGCSISVPSRLFLLKGAVVTYLNFAFLLLYYLFFSKQIKQLNFID